MVDKRRLQAAESKSGVIVGDPDEPVIVIGGPHDSGGKVVRAGDVPDSGCRCYMNSVVGVDGVAKELRHGRPLVVTQCRCGRGYIRSEAAR